MASEPITIAMTRSHYAALGIGCGAADVREVMADLGEGDRRYVLVRALFKPDEPEIMHATFVEADRLQS